MAKIKSMYHETIQARVMKIQGMYHEAIQVRMLIYQGLAKITEMKIRVKTKET